MKAVLFDLDNTLMDFVRMKTAACEATIDAMKGAGLKASKAKAKKDLYGIYKERGIEYQRVFQKLLRKLEGKVDYKILAAGVVAYREAKESTMLTYPGVKMTLAALRKRGYKLGVVSNAPSLQAWTRLVELGLQDGFDVVVTPGDVRRKKPSALPYKAALKALKAKPTDVIMVGDDPKRDIMPAKRLGMTTVLARYGVTRKYPGKANYEIRKFSGLLKIAK
ncbi:MAG: HAD-IIIA family hydrolase, partial [Candidatus Aenigmatarchaeota archaeon]